MFVCKNMARKEKGKGKKKGRNASFTAHVKSQEPKYQTLLCCPHTGSEVDTKSNKQHQHSQQHKFQKTKTKQTGGILFFYLSGFRLHLFFCVLSCRRLICGLQRNDKNKKVTHIETDTWEEITTVTCSNGRDLDPKAPAENQLCLAIKWETFDVSD